MRFCTTCQKKKEEEGGYKVPGSMRGWRCADCKSKEVKVVYKKRREPLNEATNV